MEFCIYSATIWALVFHFISKMQKKSKTKCRNKVPALVRSAGNRGGVLEMLQGHQNVL